MPICGTVCVCLGPFQLQFSTMLTNNFRLRDILRALASTETVDEDEDEHSTSAAEAWPHLASDMMFNGSARATDSTIDDIFFMGYNPGVWDFSALNDVSALGDTSFPFTFGAQIGHGNTILAQNEPHDGSSTMFMQPVDALLPNE
jgi:hypothetical protein